MQRDKLYPYVVPAGYVDRAGDWPPGFLPTIGHDVYVMLVEDMGGICRNVQPEELAETGLNIATAHRLALNNLQDLADTSAIRKGMYAVREVGERLIVWTGHWLTASCIRLPGIGEWASEALGTNEICVSIPQRESLLFFANRNRQFRDDMRNLIRSSEDEAQKLVTFELFTLAGDVLRPQIEAE